MRANYFTFSEYHFLRKWKNLEY